MNSAQKKTLLKTLLVAILAVALAGCTSPKVDKPTVVKEPTFFPPPPDEPHIQFLTHFHGSRDFEKKHRGSFFEFIVGSPREYNDSALKPYGVAFLDRKLYVADTIAHRILRFDFATGDYEVFGLTGRGVLKKPINIRVGPDKLLYITDTLREQVVVFDAAGHYVTEYGAAKVRPVDAIPTDTELFVLSVPANDRDADHNIKVFDKKTREIKRTIGVRGLKPGEFNFPNNLALDKDGNLYVCDAMNFRIQKLDPADGKPLLTFGAAGDMPGMFARPRGLAVDRNGIIYVIDARLSMIQLFNHQGRLLMFFGGFGESDGRLDLPAQIFIDYDHLEDFRKYIDPSFEAEYLIFVTNQMGPNNVSVFAFGHNKGTPPASTTAAPAATPAPAPATTTTPAATPAPAPAAPATTPAPTPTPAPAATPTPAPAPAK